MRQVLFDLIKCLHFYQPSAIFDILKLFFLACACPILQRKFKFLVDDLVLIELRDNWFCPFFLEIVGTFGTEVVYLERNLIVVVKTCSSLVLIKSLLLF